MLSTLVRNPGRAITNYATGGVGGLVRGLVGGGQPGGTPASLPAGSIFGGISGTIGGPNGIGIQLGGGRAGPGGARAAAPTGGGCPRGYHLNKHALAASKSHGAVPARSICVRNRSVNPLNPKAMSRSLRRLKRARKLVQRLHERPEPATH